MSDNYTDEEIAAFRQQLKDGSEQARAAAKAAGVTIHPRVAAMRAPAPPASEEMVRERLLGILWTHVAGIDTADDCVRTILATIGPALRNEQR